jgi:transposase
VAVVDETARVLLKATPFTEDAEGYAKLLGLPGAPTDVLVAMEATGHYWKNLLAALVAAGFAVALLNPLRTRRFAGEDLQRTQTDATMRGDCALRRAETADGQPAARWRKRGAARAGPVP